MPKLPMNTVVLGMDGAPARPTSGEFLLAALQPVETDKARPISTERCQQELT